MNISIFEAKKRLEKGESLVIYDTETTGLNKQENRILSFSAIKVIADGDSFKEIDRKNMFINPGCHIPNEVSAINHIDDAKVAGCPTEKECAKEIIDFLNSADMVTGYNSVKFDDAFINNMSKRVLYKPWEARAEFDVMNMAKEKLSKGADGDVENHKLATITEYFGAGEGLEFHNSIDDVIATTRVFWKLKDLYSEPKVTGVAYWERYSLKRLYVDNTENISLYYDIEDKEWVCEENVDLSFIDTLLSNYENNVDKLIEVTKASGNKLYF